jgi:large subunit ribosomal protein L3
MIGTLGPWHPDWVRNTVPQAGQMGYQQRTAHNIRVLLVSGKENVSMVNPKGGFTGYGLVRSDFVLLHGSIPGPSKRLVKFRDSSRQQVQSTEKITLTYVSIESKQGD